MSSRDLAARPSSGFTLPELMVASAVSALVLLGLLATHVMGLKLYQITGSKLGASEVARIGVGRLISEIRGAKRIQVGSGDRSSFVEATDGTPQQGPSLQIYPTTNQASYIRYYLDSNSLQRVSDIAPQPLTVASFLTNQVIFTSEDYAGNVLTSGQNNRVIGVTLQFYQIPIPNMPVGPGQIYDFYQIRTKVTRRALE